MERLSFALSRRRFSSGLMLGLCSPLAARSEEAAQRRGPEAISGNKIYARGGKVPEGFMERMKAQNAAAKSIEQRLESEGIKNLLEITGFSAGAPAQLPSKYNWGSSGHVTPVRKQGSCGSCWIFAALAAFESAYLIANKGVDPATIEVSAQQILDCSFAETNCVVGGWHEVVFAYLLTLGLVGANRYPYNKDNPQRGVFCNSNFGQRDFYARNWFYVNSEAASQTSMR